ncbi:hypothetical protein [Blastococcus sp. TF02-8]|uniref:hypothetical protein n=1 Tax=Blastococcus sp. TF02-8 TaxID=2250574 RepID=UPI0011BE7783|nr:hypothetical protein [Blastococcus sp. TF02-8]
MAQLLQEAAAARADSHTVEVYLSLFQEGAPPIACALAVGVVELAAGPVPRLRHRMTAPAVGGHQVDTEVVQYHHEMPGGGFVLLSFSTPQLQVLEPLVALFDAVAGSFRWLP